jgi:hypothetical protein
VGAGQLGQWWTLNHFLHLKDIDTEALSAGQPKQQQLESISTCKFGSLINTVKNTGHVHPSVLCPLSDVSDPPPYCFNAGSLMPVAAD